MDLVGKRICSAAWGGRIEEALSLQRDNPGFDINWANPDYRRWTVLHAVSYYDHVEIMEVLLTHPDINVNVENKSGQTPL